MERKTETIYLDVYQIDFTKSLTEPELIISGIRSKSNQEPWKRPIIKVRIQCQRWTPEYLLKNLVRLMNSKKELLDKDISEFAKEIENLNQ